MDAKLRFQSHTQHNDYLINELYFAFVELDKLKRFNKKISDDELLAIEIVKLQIILRIQKMLGIQTIVQDENEKENERLNFKKFFGYLYASLGPFLTGVSGFLGFRAAMTLVFHISNPTTIVLAILTGVFQGALSFYKEEGEIKKLIGTSIFKTKPMIETYRKQLDGVNEIQHHLLSNTCGCELSANNYKQYHRIINLFQEDIIQKNNQLSYKFRPTFFRQIIKYLIGGIDALLYIGSGYFMGKVLLGLIAAPLLSTPIGIGICVGLAIFSLATYYYIKRKQISDIIDNIIGDPKSLKADQDNFIHGATGIKHFNSEMKILIHNKESQENKYTKNKRQLNKNKSRRIYGHKHSVYHGQQRILFFRTQRKPHVNDIATSETKDNTNEILRH